MGLEQRGPAAMTAHGRSLSDPGFPPFRTGTRRRCYCKDMSAATGLDGLLEPLSRCLDMESAQRIVELRVAAPVQERMDALAERANEGTLSDDDRLEYEALINAADFISILKLKARQLLDSKIQ